MEHVGGTSTSAYSTTCSFSYTPSGGNLLILSIGLFAKSVVLDWHELSYPIITDTLGNIWEVIGMTPCGDANYGSGLNSGSQLLLLYVRNCLGGSDTITVTLPNDAYTCHMCVALDEYSGLDTIVPLDGFAGNQESSTLTCESGTVYTQNNVSLVYSASFCANLGSQTFTPASGFTPRQTVEEALSSLETFDSGFNTTTYNNIVTTGTESDSLHVVVAGFSSSTVPTAFVQGNVAYTQNGGTLTVSYPRNVSKGDLLVAVISPSVISSISDSLGNTWTSSLSGDLSIYTTYCNATGANEVSVALNSAECNLILAEYASPAVLSGFNSNYEYSGTSIDTGNISLIGNSYDAVFTTTVLAYILSAAIMGILGSSSQKVPFPITQFVDCSGKPIHNGNIIVRLNTDEKVTGISLGDSILSMWANFNVGSSKCLQATASPTQWKTRYQVYQLGRLVSDPQGVALFEQLGGNFTSEFIEIYSSLATKLSLDDNGEIIGNPTFWPNRLLLPEGSHYVYSVYSNIGQLVAGPNKIIL